MQGNYWAAIKTAYAAGILYGGYPFASNFKYVGAGAPTGVQKYDTLEALFNSLIDGDICIVGPGFYDEGNLQITKNNVTVIGAGNRGAVGIEPGTAGDEGLQILGDDVTLVNFGVAGNATGDYGLKVGSTTVSPARFRAYGCKFEGVDSVNPGAAVVLQGSGDTILEDCELAWCANALLFAANNDGFVTQTLIKNCRFHNYVTVGLGIITGGEVRDLWVVDNVFGRAEDGTAGTDDILLSSNNHTGFITGNRFPRATNGTGFITIGSGLIYNPNGTEAGWSTARPA